VNGDVGQGILKELEMLRKLKIFELSKEHSQAELASALGVSQPTISRMLPRKKGQNAKQEKPE
jgi:DNA-binding transcriptional regulator LsrR (DeoR family)